MLIIFFGITVAAIAEGHFGYRQWQPLAADGRALPAGTWWLPALYSNVCNT